MATLRTRRQCCTSFQGFSDNSNKIRSMQNYWYWFKNFLCLDFKSTHNQNSKFQNTAEKSSLKLNRKRSSQFFQPFLGQNIAQVHEQICCLPSSHINWPIFSLCGRNFGNLATSKRGAAHWTLLLQSHAVRGHLAGADGRVHPPEPQSLSGGRPGQGGFRQTGTLHTHTSRVADPDPNWIWIHSGQCIRTRIRIQEGKNDPQKLKHLEISHFELLVVLFWELKGSFVTWKSFIEA